MNMFLAMTLASSMVFAAAAIQDDPVGSFSHGVVYDAQPLLLASGPDDRQDRRQERGRSDERQDRRDCRQEKGRVGKDKRECKQEEVRDGVRGNQKSKDDKGWRDEGVGLQGVQRLRRNQANSTRRTDR